MYYSLFIINTSSFIKNIIYYKEMFMKEFQEKNIKKGLENKKPVTAILLITFGIIVVFIIVVLLIVNIPELIEQKQADVDTKEKTGIHVTCWDGPEYVLTGAFL